MNTWDKFSLFELEEIPDDELLEVHPSAKGENEYQTRANMTLILKDEGRLKDCPLFDENRERFSKLLSMNLSELSRFGRLMPTDSNTRPIFEKHRLLILYAIFNMSLMDEEVKTMTLYTRIHEQSLYYDESYYQYLSSVPTEDLKLIPEIRSREEFLMYYRVYMELAKREYEKFKKTRYLSYNIPFNVKQCLNVIAQRERNYSIIQREDPWIYPINYGIYPTVKNFEKIDARTKSITNPIFNAITSVLGASPYEQISYEEFIEMMQFSLKWSGLSCDVFIGRLFKSVTTTKAKKYLLAAKVRLCRKSTEDLVSKYASLTHTSSSQ